MQLDILIFAEEKVNSKINLLTPPFLIAPFAANYSGTDSAVVKRVQALSWAGMGAQLGLSWILIGFMTALFGKDISASLAKIAVLCV